MNIATVDLLLLLVLLISVVIGAWRGLLYEVLSVLGWVAAFVLAQWLAVDTADLLSLTDIASQVGYQSQAAFGKKFKELYGVAPGQLRKSGLNPVQTA